MDSGGTRPTRRRLLAVAGTSLLSATAGCGALGGESREPYEVPERTTSADRPRDGPVTAGESPLPSSARRAVDAAVGRPHRLVLVGDPLGATPPGTRLRAGFTAAPTRDGPARVVVAVTNGRDEPRTIAFGPTPPLSVPEGRPVDGEVRARRYLIPAEGPPYGDRVPEAPSDVGWEATSPIDPVGGPDETVEVLVPPGESVAREYVLLYAPDARATRRGVVAFEGAAGPTALGLGWFERDLLDRDSRFEGHSGDLPVGPTRWFHEGGAAFLRPVVERLERLRPFGFAVENYSLQPVVAGDWTLYKRVDGRWFRLGPWFEPSERPVSAVAPGGVAEIGFLRREPGGRQARARPFRRSFVLNPGLYALRYGAAPTDLLDAGTPIRVASGSDDGSVTVQTDAQSGPVPGSRRPGGSAVLAALFAVRGPSVDLRPSEGVNRVTRAGDTVTVDLGLPVVDQTDGAGADAGSPSNPDGPRLVIERVDATGGEGGGATNGEDGGVDRQTAGARRLLLEQLYEFPALQSGVAHLAPDLGRVRVLTRPRWVRRPLAALGDGSVLRFVYRGQSLVATARGLDGA